MTLNAVPTIETQPEGSINDLQRQSRSWDLREILKSSYRWDSESSRYLQKVRKIIRNNGGWYKHVCSVVIPYKLIRYNSEDIRYRRVDRLAYTAATTGSSENCD